MQGCLGCFRSRGVKSLYDSETVNKKLCSFKGLALIDRTAMSDHSGDLLKQAKAGDLPALARLLTTLEREGPGIFASLPELLAPDHFAYRIGITGPPGAGKSTLIGRLIREFRGLGLKVGVIAVDPSSPFSKGAILGDRIRYSEHFSDPGVFIRSLGSRGSLGGLSASTYLMVRAFDLAGFDIVLLETVGVGQTELEIMNVADRVAVVLVPESGDSVQGMKAGLLEIADIFLVNKSDRPGAEGFANELRASMNLSNLPAGSQKQVSILMTTATTGAGINEFVAMLEKDMAAIPPEPNGAGVWRTRRTSLERLRAEAGALLRNQAEREITARTAAITSVEDFSRVVRSPFKTI
jgi:LAO/AO transport system kinase